MAKPPLELAVEVTAADGTQYRWGSGKRAGDVPQGLSFKTKQSEGFADGSLTLSRRIDREYVDLHLLDSVVVSGADGSIAYEGRVAALPRSMQQTHSVSVQVVGWMAHARDRKLQEVYVDRDLGGWAAVSTQRQADLAAAARRYFQPDAAADVENSNPSIKTAITQPFPGNSSSEAMYDAGPGNRIARIHYAWERGGNVNNGDTNYSWSAEAWAADDQTGGSNTSGNLRGAGPGANYMNVDSYRYGLLRLLYGPAGDVSTGGQEYPIFWRPTVYGDHGLPLVGTTDPKGLAASDVIRHVAGKYCPALNTSGVQATTYPIPHLVFKDRTDPYDAFLEVNKYHLWQLAVYDNRTLSYGPIDMSDYDWEVRLSDFGTTVDLQGDSTSTLANGIVVQYQNVATGHPDVLTPDNHPELRDLNDSNPATLHGLNVWTEISLSSPTTPDAALQLGRAALAEYNQPKSPGTINVQGHIRDRAGHWQPVWRVRAGDRIIISDHANDRPRLVVESDYTHDSKTISIAVDSSFKRLDAVLDRLGTALKAANLAA